MEKSTHTTTAMVIFFIATAVMLIGGLAVMTFPVQEAYADKTTCRTLGGGFSECVTQGKNPSGCTTLGGGEVVCSDFSNRETAQGAKAIRDECRAGAGTCTVEGGKP
jgi:hypothetical protein